MESLESPLIVEGLVMFALDMMMVIKFCKITFQFVEILEPPGFNRRLRIALVKVMTACFTLRAISADLMCQGPSILYLWLFRGMDCDY